MAGDLQSPFTFLDKVNHCVGPDFQRKAEKPIRYSLQLVSDWSPGAFPIFEKIGTSKLSRKTSTFHGTNWPCERGLDRVDPGSCVESGGQALGLGICWGLSGSTW